MLSCFGTVLFIGIVTYAGRDDREKQHKYAGGYFSPRVPDTGKVLAERRSRLKGL